MTRNALRQFSGGATAPILFTNADATTSGNWQGTYGSDGYLIQDVTPIASLPSYVSQPTVSGQLQIWLDKASETRALQNPQSPGYRVAAAWTTTEAQNSTITIDLNLTDGNTHKISLYCTDWLGTGNTVEKIEVFDYPDTTTPIDTRSFVLPPNGLYVVWKLTGHKTIRITKADSTTGNKAMVSAVFFDPAP